MQLEDALANIVETLDDEEIVDDELRKELLHPGPAGPRFELLVDEGHVLGSRALPGSPASETVKMRGAPYESNGYDMTAATLSLSKMCRQGKTGRKPPVCPRRILTCLGVGWHKWSMSWCCLE